MIADIVLIIIYAVLTLIHVILLVPDALISIGSFNLIILPMIAWLFTPLRLFGYWIDLPTLGIAITYALIILTIYYIMKLVLFAVGFIPGIGRSKTTLEKL